MSQQDLDVFVCLAEMAALEPALSVEEVKLHPSLHKIGVRDSCVWKVHLPCGLGALMWVIDMILTRGDLAMRKLSHIVLECFPLEFLFALSSPASHPGN